MSVAVALQDDTFEQQIGDVHVVLVDFWSETCVPCKTLSPIIDELANDLASEKRVLIGKVNVEENPNLAERFRIRGLPAVLILKQGESVKKFLGVQAKEAYHAAIVEQLS